MVIFYLESSIEEAQWLTADEKALLARNLDSGSGDRVPESA